MVFDEQSFSTLNFCICMHSQLETFYPQYPSEEDFLNYTNGLKVDDNWRLLARFLMEKKQLEVKNEH